jgi:plasmid replication initiation protein
VLIDIFVRIESFFKRLESYTEVRPTAAMIDVIVKILIEVLSILAITTKQIKQGRSSESIEIHNLLFAYLF